MSNVKQISDHVVVRSFKTPLAGARTGPNGVRGHELGFDIEDERDGQYVTVDAGAAVRLAIALIQMTPGDVAEVDRDATPGSVATITIALGTLGNATRDYTAEEAIDLALALIRAAAVRK